LKGLYGGTISILDAFLNTFGVWMFGFMADLIILDLLIVGTLTKICGYTWNRRHERERIQRLQNISHQSTCKRINSVGDSQFRDCGSNSFVLKAIFDVCARLQDWFLGTAISLSTDTNPTRSLLFTV
jgi:hypothetical protein